MAEVPVKVFVRVRPLLELERLKSSEECVRLVSQDQLVLGNDRSFRFDHIFPQDTAQSNVYECCVSTLLSSCLDGYNSTVLAYGQTGSGKSFTLGSETSPNGYELSENRGVIPRALDELFHLLESRNPTAECRVTVSYVEIYKEELRDLLDGGGVVSQPLVIREDDQGNTVLLGAMEIEVGTADEALGWLEVGNTARVTAATHMNQRSSRSHAVFTLHIEQRWKVDPEGGGVTVGVDVEGALGQGGGEAPVMEDTNENQGQLEQCVAAKFHFVDLAGSERVSKTGNKGERFKESVHINSGLLALGNVISALGDPKRKSSHVPYRESKITRLLKDSLGGNARTSMIACLSPAVDNFAENLNTLKYAKRARNIRNRPVVNKDPAVSRMLEMREEIAALRSELYRTQLSSSKPTTAATTVNTVDSSVMVELSDVEGHIVELEAELEDARRRSQYYHHALSSIRDLIGRLSTEGMEEVVVTSDLLKQIKHWLEYIKSIEGSAIGSDSPSSVLTERAMETIRLLRRELERCQVDLQTDEELFAEKIEELNQLQLAYNQLVREKERLEEMWLASQENEGLLQSEVFQLKEHLSSMARELAEKERGGEREGKEREGERDSLGEESTHEEENSLVDIKPNEVFGELESSSQHQVMGEAGEGGEGRGEGDDRYTATRSLLRGKVKTASLEDFSEEAVTRSLLTLNSCLAQHILPHIQSNNRDSRHDRADAISGDLNELRPMTPLETSQSEPLQSKSSGGSAGGHAHSPPTSLGGTYKIEDGGKIIKVGGAVGVALEQAEELELLNESALESRRQLTTAEEKLSRAHEEHRNLNLKIRLKEELIRELVKSSRSMKELNQSYVAKIQQLEKEASKVERELVKTQGLLQRQHSQSSGSHEDRELGKLVEEHKKQLAVTEKKLKALQRKQKEAQRMVQSGERSERRIDELESGIERLRNQQEMMKRKLKKQAEKKLKLENGLQKYEVRIRNLQTHSEQQSKVLKRKTEEAAVAQRKLRQLNSGSRPSTHKGGESYERAWLDEEVERVLQRKRDVEALEKELAARERIIVEKEALIGERDELEAKKIRSSHSAARDIVRLSQQINTLEDSIRLRQEGGGVKGRGKVDGGDKEQEIAKLRKERDELVKQCEVVRMKVHEGALLPPDQEQRLYELNEHIEILDATINFKNSSINSQELHLAQLITDSEEETRYHSQLHSKLHSLPLRDAQALLVRYFHKVVRLRLEEGREVQRQREMDIELEGQRDAVRRLERSLRQTRVDCERELLSQQKEHEKQVQVLIQQLAEANTPSPSEVALTSSSQEDSERCQALESKVKLLEKDLFYYKKTSRELKKRLQQSESQPSGVGKGQKVGEEGGREGKKKVAHSGRSHDQDITSEGVADSLEVGSMNKKGLTVSGTSLIASTKREESCATSAGVVVDKVGQAPPIATPTDEAQQPVIRKQKKQLRQLSASDVAALKQRKNKSSRGTS